MFAECRNVGVSHEEAEILAVRALGYLAEHQERMEDFFQLTGVASRHVGLYIAGILILLALFPVVGGVLQLMPKPVLGGATLIMFGTVAIAGIKILAEAGLHRRNMLIVCKQCERFQVHFKILQSV